MPAHRALLVMEPGRQAEHIERTLESMGHESVGRTDRLADATDHLRRGEADIVFLDGDLGGHPADPSPAEEIGGQFDVPLVVLGGDSAVTRRAEGLEDSVVAYLDKPIRPGCLRHVLDWVERTVRAETALRSDRARLEAMIEAFDGLIYVCRPDYRIDYMNPALIERTGRDATGELCYRVLHDRDAPCPWCRNEEVFAGRAVRWEIQSPKDGRWYAVSNTPLRMPNGQIYKQSLIRDITAERNAQQQLARSEERYRAYVSHSALGIARFEVTPPIPLSWPADRQVAALYDQAVLRECNDALVEVFGGADEAASLTGRTLRDVAPDSAAVSLGLASFVRRNYRLATIEWEQAIAGRMRTLTASATGMVEEDRLGRVWLSVRDVTEQRQAERQLQFSRRMDTVGQLAGGIAHHYNNLLTVVLGNAEWLSKSVRPESEQAEVVGEVLRAGRLAAELTRSLLAFAEPGPPGRGEVHVDALLDQMADLVRHSLPQTIRVAFSLDAEGGTIRGNADQIQHAVMNLLLNAQDAMPHGGELTLRTAVERFAECHTTGRGQILPAGGYVRIDVEDTGRGMSAETLARVFDPFFTTREVGQGIGMGLPHAEAWVSAHGGTLELASEQGRGTRATILLPLAE